MTRPYVVNLTPEERSAFGPAQKAARTGARRSAWSSSRKLPKQRAARSLQRTLGAASSYNDLRTESLRGALRTCG